MFCELNGTKTGQISILGGSCPQELLLQSKLLILKEPNVGSNKLLSLSMFERGKIDSPTKHLSFILIENSRIGRIEGANKYLVRVSDSDRSAIRQ